MNISATKNHTVSIEAEQAIIGGIILDSSCLSKVSSILVTRDFSDIRNKTIYGAFFELEKLGIKFEVLSVCEHLNSKNLLKQAGDWGYVVEVVKETSGSSNILVYSKIVQVRSTIRQLIKLSDDLSKSAVNLTDLNVNELLSTLTARVSSLTKNHHHFEVFTSFNKLMFKAVKRLDDLFRSDGDLSGVSTGFSKLNEFTSGWQDGELIIVGGRPSMGKTTLCLNFIISALLTQKKPVIFFSLEMTKNSIVNKLLSCIGKINSNKFRNAKFIEGDWSNLNFAVNKLKDLPLIIDDGSELAPDKINDKVLSLLSSRSKDSSGGESNGHGDNKEVGLIVIDYLQLLSNSGSKDNRTQELSKITRALKLLAKNLNCPVMVISQLNRGVESRVNNRPMNSDLRDSGAIEQDADIILFVYRDEVYNPDSTQTGVAELILSKNRNGGCCVVYSTFSGKFSSFAEI